MKIFLCLIIVALLGLCGSIYFTATRPTESHRVIISGLKAELRESRVEFDRSQEALATAKEEVERLKERLSSLEERAASRIFSDQDSPVPVEQTAPVVPSVPATPPVAAAPAPTGTLESRLSELKGIFESNLLSIENRKDLLKIEIASLQNRRRSVANTELYFSEQSTRVDMDGFVRGNRGVRTSSADRDRAETKIADKVAEVDQEIAKKQVEMASLVSEMESLRKNYSKAILRARAEFASNAFPSQ